MRGAEESQERKRDGPRIRLFAEKTTDLRHFQKRRPQGAGWTGSSSKHGLATSTGKASGPRHLGGACKRRLGKKDRRERDRVPRRVLRGHEVQENLAVRMKKAGTAMLEFGGDTGSE